MEIRLRHVQHTEESIGEWNLRRVSIGLFRLNTAEDKTKGNVLENDDEEEEEENWCQQDEFFSGQLD